MQGAGRGGNRAAPHPQADFVTKIMRPVVWASFALWCFALGIACFAACRSEEPGLALVSGPEFIVAFAVVLVGAVAGGNGRAFGPPPPPPAAALTHASSGTGGGFGGGPDGGVDCAAQSERRA